MPGRARSRGAVPAKGGRRRAQPARAGAPAGTAGDGGISHQQIVEIQRSRLLAAAVAAVDELGYADATVSDVTHRARVSRRTFYELFANREECLIAVLEDVVALIAEDVARAGVEGLPWCERVRRGLWAILAFLDREPVLARVCVIQALRGGPEVLARREEILAGLARVVDGGRGEGAHGGRCTPLTAEGVVGAAFAIVYARLLRGEPEPLTGLVGELMGIIVLPYRGAAAVRRELERPVGRPAASSASAPSVAAGEAVRDPLEGVSMRLTYRTARVLEGVAEHPGASNRMVAERAGIHDPGQVSKLLRRLEGLGLLANSGEGHAKGEPNAWGLTPRGQRVAQSIRIHARGEREAA
jgi:AcrR family transcriptional regulator